MTKEEHTEIIVIDQCRGLSPTVNIPSAVGTFAPSRGGDVKGTAFAGAAQNHPSGRAQPSLTLGH